MKNIISSTLIVVLVFIVFLLHMLFPSEVKVSGNNQLLAGTSSEDLNDQARAGFVSEREPDEQKDQRKYGSISGRVIKGEKVLPHAEVALMRSDEKGGWKKLSETVTCEEGSYRFELVAGGDYLVGLTSMSQWHPAFISLSGEKLEEIDIGSYDFTLLLDEGWNLLSLPRWAADGGIVFPEPVEEYIEAWITFRDGNWIQGQNEITLEEALNNPAGAVYIKALKPTFISINWAEETSDLKTAEQMLSPGWNLISSSYEENYRIILAGLTDLGKGGLTQFYAPNEVNSKKSFNFFLPWEKPLQSMITAKEGGNLRMYPLDGYWVYLNGDPLTYSTMVSPYVPESKMAD